MTRPGLSRQARLAAVAETVLDAGALPVRDLAHEFDVTVMTIYRDIADLEAAGVVHLQRGTVIAHASSVTETSNAFRSTLNLAEKQRLCAAAAALIRPGSTVMLDDSSTLQPIVPMLAELAPITVITNSQAVAALVHDHPQVRLFVTGGTYRRQLESYGGETTVAVLRSLAADLCLMSATAIERGVIYHPLEDNAAVKRAMLAAASRRVLLVDASKFRQHATHRVGSVADFDRVFVTGEIPDVEWDALREAGVVVTQV